MLDRLFAPFRRLIASVWQPTAQSLRGFALASVIANVVIISTGAAVRLSSSGLGCPDWPTCTQSSAFAAHSTGQTLLNSWIEFGNRLLNGPLILIAGLTFIVFLRYSLLHGGARRDLVRLSSVQPLGVVAQAVLGGIVVLLKLPPALVAGHFLLSSAIILTAAVVLHARAPRGLDGPDADRAQTVLAPPARADLRVIAGLLTVVTAVMLAAGTVVTGTGPLAGVIYDSHGHRTTVPRFHFPLESVTQLHADIGWFIGALTVALVIGLRLSGAPRRTMRLGFMVLTGLGLQGIIGYVQYFNHLPAGLVWVHVSLSAVIWTLVLRLYLTAGPARPMLLLRPDAPDGAEAPGDAPEQAAGAAPSPAGTVLLPPAAVNRTRPGSVLMNAGIRSRGRI